MPTDKKILMRGLKYMSGALPLFFIGPIVINSSFKNQGHPMYIPILGLGIICCILAMWFMFAGLRTIMRSMVD